MNDTAFFDIHDEDRLNKLILKSLYIIYFLSRYMGHLQALTQRNFLKIYIYIFVYLIYVQYLALFPVMFQSHIWDMKDNFGNYAVLQGVA